MNSLSFHHIVKILYRGFFFFFVCMCVFSTIIAPTCIVPFLALSDLRKGIGAENYTCGCTAGVITLSDEGINPAGSW